MGCTDSICVLFENEQDRFCLISRAGFSQSSDWFLSSKHEQKPFRCFLHPSSIIHYRSRSPLISILPCRHAVKNRTNRKYYTFGSSMDSVVSIRFNGSHNFYLMANFLFIFLSFFIEIILSFRLVRKSQKYTQYIMIYIYLSVEERMLKCSLVVEIWWSTSSFFILCIAFDSNFSNYSFNLPNKLTRNGA